MTRVVVNGSFDVLHLGHIGLLKYAKSFTNSYVLVLTDTDKRIQQLKGFSRPINNELERCTMLSSLRYVDRVETFDTDKELIDHIKNFNPDIMVKGSDYRNKPILGSEYCKEIKFYDRIEKYSTTKKIQDIIDRR
jgi:rfaE bifunctional protein nucleotidyltransferase chain/domain